jgi:putative DNA primase/helicase
MTDVHAIARSLGGEVTGRHRVLAPGPGHSRADRSLSVTLSPTAPTGIVVHSFAGDDWRDCRKYVFDRLGIREREEQRSRSTRSVQPQPTDNAANEVVTERERSRYAVSIFEEAEDLRGSPAYSYLARRGIDVEVLPDRISESLRWHPECPWESSRHGAMVGLFTDAQTGEPRAVHRTAITPDGEKVGRKCLGPKAGAVIRLWPDGGSLVVGEGLETVLSAATRVTHRGAPLVPAWAAGDAGNLEAFPVIESVSKLTILVDNDTSGRGQQAAKVCARRWKAAGKEVVRLMPPEVDTDFNDFVRFSHGLQ